MNYQRLMCITLNSHCHRLGQHITQQMAKQIESEKQLRAEVERLRGEIALTVLGHPKKAHGQVKLEGKMKGSFLN